MSDRAFLPIPARVRNRMMFALPITTLSCLLVGGASTSAFAQANPTTPPATAPAGTAPPGTAPGAPGTGTTVGGHLLLDNPGVDPNIPNPFKTSLLVIVKSTDPGTPAVPFAAVRLDSDTERPRSLLSNQQGNALFARITDGAYLITVSALQRKTTRPLLLQVLPNRRNTITVFMSPQGDIEATINGIVDLLDATDYSISYTRDKRFMRDFPMDAANHQDLNSFLVSVPGVAYDGAGNYYARGDGAIAGTTMIDGLLAPAGAQGGAAGLYQPDAIESFRSIVGNFAPEYGGNGMVTVLKTNNIPLDHPILDASVRAGNYGTADDSLTFANRVYPDIHSKSAYPQASRTFQNAPIGYTFTVSQHYTDNALDPPQAGQQTISNFGQSTVAMAKFDYRLKNDATLQALLNYTTARTDIADRTQLPSSYDYYGNGLGFAGAALPGSVTATQQDDGKSDLQKDNNLLAIIELSRRLPNGGLFEMYAGSNHSTLNMTSGTPLSLNLGALPGNSSVEFRPYVNNDYQTTLLQADVTSPPKNGHQFKYGLLYQDILGREAYQYVPGSQTALDALYALDPRLVPTGGQVTGNIDPLGFPNYVYHSNVTTFNTPVIVTNRTGAYAAAYVQDTWKFRPRLTFNYGLRIDDYTAKTATARLDPESGYITDPGQVPNLTSTEVSPRLNGVLEFPQNAVRFKLLNFLTSSPTIARFGYNRLFSAPGVSQGNFVGEQIGEGYGGYEQGQPAQAQTTDQYDTNIERQVGSRGRLRFGFYSKQINHYLETEQLIPGLQDGMLAVFNQGKVESDGEDITMEVVPGNLRATADTPGIHLFVSYENSQTHPTSLQQFDNLGAASGAQVQQDFAGRFAPYVDGDQSDTLSFGLNRRQKDGSSFGLSGYYGSGLYESAVRFYGLPTRESSTRQGYEDVNFSYSTGPRFLNKTGTIKLEVANLLNTKERIDYLGAFGGTRFQQGTRVFLDFSAHL